MHVGGGSGVGYLFIHIQKIWRDFVRRWQDLVDTTDLSKFEKTAIKGEAGRVENIETL